MGAPPPRKQKPPAATGVAGTGASPSAPVSQTGPRPRRPLSRRGRPALYASNRPTNLGLPPKTPEGRQRSEHRSAFDPRHHYVPDNARPFHHLGQLDQVYADRGESQDVRYKERLFEEPAEFHPFGGQHGDGWDNGLGYELSYVGPQRRSNTRKPLSREEIIELIMRSLSRGQPQAGGFRPPSMAPLSRSGSPLRYSGYRAPAGGVIVRGLHYTGGEFIPGKGKDIKTDFEKYQKIHADAAKYQRPDGSYDYSRDRGAREKPIKLSEGPQGEYQRPPLEELIDRPTPRHLRPLDKAATDAANNQDRGQPGENFTARKPPRRRNSRQAASRP